MSSEGPDERSAVTLALHLMLAMWVLLPVSVWGTYAQDALAFLTAGALFQDEPEAIYASNDLTDPDADRYYEELCARAGDPQCVTSPAGYFSPPAALPLLGPLSALPDDAGVFLQRLLGAVAGAGAIFVLRRRIGPDHDAQLLATTVLLTPLMVHTVSLGQNTPLLALSAALGVSTTDSGRAIGHGLLVALTIALKAFTLVLLAPLLLWRRWRELAAAAGGIAALSIVATILQPDLWRPFLDALERADDALVWDYQVSLASTLVRAFPSLDAWHGRIPLLTIVLLAAVWYRWGRHCTRDLTWAWLLASLVVVTTSAWPHYYLVPVPLLVLATHHRRDALVWLPALYAAGTIALVATWGTSSSLTLLAPAGTLLAIAAAPALALSAPDRGARPAG